MLTGRSHRALGIGCPEWHVSCPSMPCGAWGMERRVIEQRKEADVARGRDEQQERERGTATNPTGARAGAEERASTPREAAGSADTSHARGFFVRATERRVYVRPHGSSRESMGRSSGDAFDRETGRGTPRGYGRERPPRQARDRHDGSYAEGRARNEGLPSDLRAGEGQWTRPGGYAELGRERGVEGYEPGYEQGEWAPGGDASVPLRMGYGDYGVRRETARGEATRPRRWRREPVLARDIMTGNPNAVRPEASLREVARIMREENTGIVPVCDAGGALLGVVTDRDIVMRTLANDTSPDQATAGDVMTDDVEAVTPDEELRDVVHLMGERQVRRIPVVERGDRLVGIISMADVATRADFDEDLQDALEDISARRSFWSRLFR